MSNNIKITVGIPAFNEAANIKNLLVSIINQQETIFTIDQILVVSDGSSDDTVFQARSLDDSRIIVFDHKDRKGKAARQNEIIENNHDNYLILLDGDILLKNPNCFAQMIDPMRINPKIGLISVKATPLPAKVFLEKVLNFSIATKDKIFEQINDGNNIYFSRGTARVFSPEFLKVFKWEKNVAGGEDAYSYLACLKAGFEFRYTKNAEIFFQSPRSVKDYFKQSTRFFSNRKQLSDGFGKEFVSEQFYLPRKVLLKVMLQQFFSHPLLSISYGLILIFSRILSLTTKSSATWSQAKSSKILQTKS